MWPLPHVSLWKDNKDKEYVQIRFAALLKEPLFRRRSIACARNGLLKAPKCTSNQAEIFLSHFAQKGHHHTVCVIFKSLTNLQNSPFWIPNSNQIVFKLQIVGEFGKQVDAKSWTTHDVVNRGIGRGWCRCRTWSGRRPLKERCDRNSLWYVSISYVFSSSLAILQGTPRSTLHLPLTGSGGAKLTNGGSSRNPTVKWNFSGTPWGGTWLWPGHTMSLISNPLLSSW